MPETSSHVIDNEQGSGTIAQFAHPFRKVLSWQLKIPENFLFLTNALFIHNHLPLRLYVYKSETGLLLRPPAVSVIKGTDKDGSQVVFTGGGRLQKTAQIVVLVVNLLRVVRLQHLVTGDKVELGDLLIPC